MRYSYDDGPRYPGSLVVTYAKNRAHDWSEKYARRASGRPPGRLQRAKGWLLPRLLRVEGLLLGGAAALALAAFGAEHSEAFWAQQAVEAAQRARAAAARLERRRRELAAAEAAAARWRAWCGAPGGGGGRAAGWLCGWQGRRAARVAEGAAAAAAASAESLEYWERLQGDAGTMVRGPARRGRRGVVCSGDAWIGRLGGRRAHAQRAACARGRPQA
ncbi:MAG: hypothetical protein J3K34DRAFT_507609 [Monoraphidium minutum]|nr:MAG: hypothetical protein J3K34DRAFT_507609 [Monoraphidium minutum]